MVAVYVLSTPIGVFLGILLNENYNENAQGTLIATGVLDSISAGILISDSLVNILGPHFQSPGYKGVSTKAKAAQLFFFWLGCGIMAFIGKYA